MNIQNNVPASVRAFLSKIGNQLKNAREEKKLTREDVCRGLKIHINFLIALEEGLFEDLPGANSFFASLRTYSKFLGLDTEKIIGECKKNHFLFQALQGEGIIQRPQSQAIELQLEQKPKNIIPESLEKLEIGEQKESFDSSNTNILDSKTEQKNKKTIRKNLFWITLIIFIIFLGGIFLIKSTNLMSNKYVCDQLTIKARKEIDIKIVSLSMNQPLLERNLSLGEEIKLSDSKGLKIYVSEPNFLELKEGFKIIHISDLPKKSGSFIFECN